MLGYENVKLKEISIERKNGKYFSGQYYICAKYEEDSDACIREHVITAPLCLSSCPSVDIDTSIYNVEPMVSVDLGFGYLENAKIETKIIKEKEKEMTIEEIEKALGHKIKIVGEQKNVGKSDKHN